MNITVDAKLVSGLKTLAIAATVALGILANISDALGLIEIVKSWF